MAISHAVSDRVNTTTRLRKIKNVDQMQVRAEEKEKNRIIAIRSIDTNVRRSSTNANICLPFPPSLGKAAIRTGLFLDAQLLLMLFMTTLCTKRNKKQKETERLYCHRKS